MRQGSDFESDTKQYERKHGKWPFMNFSKENQDNLKSKETQHRTIARETLAATEASQQGIRKWIKPVKPEIKGEVQRGKISRRSLSFKILSFALFSSCNEFSIQWFRPRFWHGFGQIFTCAMSLHGTVQILLQIAVLVYESIQHFTVQTFTRFRGCRVNERRIRASFCPFKICPGPWKWSRGSDV